MPIHASLRLCCANRVKRANTPADRLNRGVFENQFRADRHTASQSCLLQPAAELHRLDGPIPKCCVFGLYFVSDPFGQCSHADLCSNMRLEEARMERIT